MPTRGKTQKFLSKKAVQKIVTVEMPGYRVVELSPAQEAPTAEDVRRKATRSLPSLVHLRAAGRKLLATGHLAHAPAPDADASSSDIEITGVPHETEEGLWGNSSQFALIEPSNAAARATDAGDTAKRRTVVVSNGRIVTEQG